MDTFITIQELVLEMRKTRSADYANWGLFLGDGKNPAVQVGLSVGDGVVDVPLIDIVDCAATCYPWHGYEEIFVVFAPEAIGIDWGLVAVSQ